MYKQVVVPNIVGNSGNTQDALTACTATCKSYNCTDTGCVIVTGSGGTFYELNLGVQDSLYSMYSILCFILLY